MTTDINLIEMPNNIANANVVKDMVLQQLHDDNIITAEQLEHYGNQWHIVIIKNGWFKSIIKRIGLNNTKGYFHKYVKFTLE